MNWRLIIGGGAPPAVTAASFYHDTITVGDGTANAFIYQPEDIENPPTGGWPLIIYFGGDGTSGNTTRTFTDVAMSTGDNLTYTHSPTAALYRVVPSTIVVKVNGTTVATGAPGGAITGTGVTGSITGFDIDSVSTNTSPTISVTFDSSQSGNTVTVSYIDTTVVAEGPMRWANTGDTFDNNAVVMTIQNVQSTSDFDIDYWDKAVEYAWTNFTINRNRISAAGISRGGRAVLDSPGILVNRYQFWINESTGAVSATDLGAGYVASGLASLVCGTASYGGSYTAANYTEIGMAIVHGISDSTLTNGTPGFAATMGSNNEPPYILNTSAGFGGHNNEVWDGECFKRLYRVGGTIGSLPDAKWDWVDFLLKYSRDAEERATLFVEQVEKRRYNTEKDIIDYRNAARKVAGLSAGATKTALEGRLSTVKSSIDNGGTRWVFNPHGTGFGESGNYVNIATDAVGLIASNVVDFDGGSSTVDISWSDSPVAGFTDVASNRRSFTGGFSLTANGSGIDCVGWPFTTLGLAQLPSGTYTVRVYHNVGVVNFTTNPTLNLTINSVTVVGYSAINTLIGYEEYTGLTEAQVASIQMARNNDDTAVTIIELYKAA